MTSHTLPDRPDLVLRLGFAGNRELQGNLTPLAHALDDVLGTAASRLVALAEGKRLSGEPASIVRFYSKTPPMLRLVTGLAEGADSLAADALTRVRAVRVRTELAAVLPFDVTVYRGSRDPAFQPAFDAQLGRCAYVVELGGYYQPGNAGGASAARARAYRAQSTVLLRQIDVLIAMAARDARGKAGGTLETVQAALAFNLPVVFIDASTATVDYLEPGSDPVLSIALGQPRRIGGPSAVPSSLLDEWIEAIVAGPNAIDSSVAPVAPKGQAQKHASKSRSKPERMRPILDEFFDDDAAPPRHTRTGNRVPTIRERLWAAFNGFFRPPPTQRPRDLPLAPYASYRDRVTALNYHYSGLYRGAFLLNYTLAVTAVGMAALSLALIGHHHGAAPTWALGILGATKLACVVGIYSNTHRANHERWSDKAVDYRYLAERLRAMFYLPRAGSFRPPAAVPPQFSSRVVRQSAVDWLFEAIVRHISPAVFAAKVPVRTGSGTSTDVHILRLDPVTSVGAVQTHWIGGQLGYHEDNEHTMSPMHSALEGLGRAFNYLVIGTVLVDLGVLALFVSSLLPQHWSHLLHGATPWLLFMAAVLPAAVASLRRVSR